LAVVKVKIPARTARIAPELSQTKDVEKGTRNLPIVPAGPYPTASIKGTADALAIAEKVY
jgi:hypothetical protein